MIKFLAKSVAAGAIFYATVEALEKLKVADRVVALGDGLLSKLTGYVPTGFAEDATPDETVENEARAGYYETWDGAAR